MVAPKKPRGVSGASSASGRAEAPYSVDEPSRTTVRHRAGRNRHHPPAPNAYRMGMTDDRIHENIEKLVAEEHELWSREGAGAATEGDRRRLEQVRVSLDRCWDLLRQRRALREFGGDADQARVRSEETVEG